MCYNGGMKRIVSIAIYAALMVSLSVSASADAFGSFLYSYNYSAGQFLDVSESDWYARYVEDAYNFGLIMGKSSNEFAPEDVLTFGEAVTIVARIRSIYYTGRANFAVSNPFYSVYADYARANGFIDRDGGHDFNAPATRAQFAELIFSALPSEALEEINTISDYGITDVVHGTHFSDAVYALYRAGILSGSDRFGTFLPHSNITRAEVGAITVRLASPDARIRTTLPTQIPAEIIYRRSIDAVFTLETFDTEGESIRTGTGFFITSGGLAVTNLHVLDNAADAEITFSGKDRYAVRGVHAVCRENNLAVISIDSDAGDWSILNMANSDLIETGNTVYVIGNPMELTGTITDGIVSNSMRDVDGSDMIQFSAPISFGSGGSPLLNARGQVIGVASTSYSYGQNLNLAVPINFVKDLRTDQYVSLESLLEHEE